jgi:hypothetical protein
VAERILWSITFSESFRRPHFEGDSDTRRDVYRGLATPVVV